MTSKLIKKIISMADMGHGEKMAMVMNDSVLAKLIAYNKSGFNLPEGLPFDGEGLEFEDMTNLYQEARRLYIFSKDEKDNPPALKMSRREDLFLDMIKGFDKDEALLLSAVKDGKMLELYSQLEGL